MSFLPPFLQTLSKYTGDLASKRFGKADVDNTRACTISLGSAAAMEQATALIPIFQALNAQNKQSFLPKPVNLQDDNSFFPSEGANLDGLPALAKAFKSAYEQLEDSTSEAIFTENLLPLVKHFYSRVGASPAAPFVSVYDHCRLVGALYDCLTRTEATAEAPFLLVAAGLDGIQSFCYNVMRNKASKSIKGRSFYLQVLMDTLAQRIVFDPAINATTGHILYARGGKLRILLPNTEAIRDKLKDIEKELRELLFEKHDLTLSLHMTSVPFHENQLEAGLLWQQLEEEIMPKLKSQPAKETLLAEFDDLFLPLNEEIEEGDGDGPKICSVTAKFIAKPEAKANLLNLYDEDEGEKGIWVDVYINEIARLGAKLQLANGDLIYITPGINNKYNSLSERLGFVLEQGLKRKSELSNNLPSGAIAKEFNSFNPNAFGKKLNGGIHAYQYYGGNKQAVNEKVERKGWYELREFSELAEYQSGSGYTRLGVLRMDIDKLGEAIEDLLKKQKALGAYTVIAAQLDEFFGGYLNTLREEHKDNLNILFAGGDDVMVVGRWDDVIAFADKTRDSFQRFIGTANGADEPLTLSAGIALVPPTFPIHKANQLAEDALDDAKGSGRNAINLFDISMKWAEWQEVKKMQGQLKDYTSSNVFSQGFLHALQIFHETKNAHKMDVTGKTKPNKSYLWVSAYYISRYKERVRRDNKEAHDFLEEVKTSFFKSMQNKGRYYDLMAVAARWAEFENRAGKTKQKAEQITIAGKMG